MTKRTKKQKVWNTYKNSLYGKSKLRLNKKGKQVHLIPVINNNHVSDEPTSWIKPFNMGV